MSSGLSLAIRIILITVAALTLIFITRKLRKSQIALENSILWFILSFLFLLVSFFPQIFDLLANITGVFSTTNFVFMFFIGILLIICFNLSIKHSKEETKIKELAQELALLKNETKSKDSQIS